jgi:hypothetical protein
VFVGNVLEVALRVLLGGVVDQHVELAQSGSRLLHDGLAERRGRAGRRAAGGTGGPRPSTSWRVSSASACSSGL